MTRAEGMFGGGVGERQQRVQGVLFGVGELRDEAFQVGGVAEEGMQGLDPDLFGGMALGGQQKMGLGDGPEVAK